MKRFVSLFLAIGLSLSAVNRTGGQTPQDQEEVIRFRTNEVKLDIVVKDKKGRPVRDLTASDYEVMEDGVPQKIQSFRFVSREAQPVTTVTSEQKDNRTQPTSPVPTPKVTPVQTSPGITAL